jgi:hypothetical protein
MCLLIKLNVAGFKITNIKKKEIKPLKSIQIMDYENIFIINDIYFKLGKILFVMFFFLNNLNKIFVTN